MNIIRRLEERTRWADAKSAADFLTRDYSSPPIPVTDIAKLCDVKLVVESFGDQGSDGDISGFCDFAGGVIYANADETFKRQRFTIAHELGHWVLHKNFFIENPEKYPVLMRKTELNIKDHKEQEANHFAANLLVPDRLIKPIKNLHYLDLASLFDVSPSMMQFRLMNVA